MFLVRVTVFSPSMLMSNFSIHCGLQMDKFWNIYGIAAKHISECERGKFYSSLKNLLNWGFLGIFSDFCQMFILQEVLVLMIFFAIVKIVHINVVKVFRSGILGNKVSRHYVTLSWRLFLQTLVEFYLWLSFFSFCKINPWYY